MLIRKSTIVCLLTSTLALVGCHPSSASSPEAPTSASSSKELTRTAAKAAIEQVISKNNEVTVTDAEFDVWNRTGYWAASPDLQSGGYQLTSSGRRFFTTVKLVFGRGVVLQTIKPLPQRVVAVTGISDAPSSQNGTAKLVDFTWNYNLDGQPDEIRRLLSDRQDKSERAVFRLYDDGWRIEAKRR